MGRKEELLQKSVYPGERLALGLSILTLSFLFYGAYLIGPSVPFIALAGSLLLIRSRQGQLLGNSAYVSETHYTQLNYLTIRASNYLAMDKPRVHVVQDPYLNAFALGFTKPFSVVINSSLLQKLSDDELLFVIGHELGHIKRKHTRWLSFIAPFGKTLPVLDLIFNYWQRKCEYSCDRMGLLVCQDIDASIRAVIKISAGPDAFQHTDIESFLKQAILAKNSKVDAIAEVLGTHPYITNRIIQLVAFYNRYLAPTGTEEAAATKEHHRIVSCPNSNCQAKLRLPKSEKTLNVTCPKCKEAFKLYPE